MGTRTYTLTFAGAGTLTLPGGVFFYIKSASAALVITTRGSTTAPIAFENVGAGLRFGPVPIDKRWTYLDVTSTVGQVVEAVVSDDAEVDIASTVNVAGSVTIQELPATALSTPAASNVLTATALSVAANPARKRIKVCNDPANSGNVYLQAVGAGAGRGVPIQPGMYEEVKGTYAFDVRNDSGSTVVVTLAEET